MKNNLVNLLKSSFLKHTAIMASGTVGAQVVSMVLSPIITRLYGPDAFGVMGTFSAITRIIIPIAALTYPIAIVLPRDDKDAKGLIRLSIVITSLIALLSLILIILFNNLIVKTFNLEEFSMLLYLIPIVVMFAGLMQVIEQWLIRMNQFSINANATFLQSILVNGSKVGIGIFFPTATVLVLLTALSNGIRAALMSIFANRSVLKINKINNSEENKLRKMLELLRKYRDFPLFRAPQEFINSITQGLPTLMLTTFFGPASVGFYTIGVTVLRLPSQIIGKSVGDVFYPRIAKAANNNENVSELLKKTTLGLVGVAIVPFGIFVFFGPSLFSFVFGSDWVTAGEYARWIAVSSFFSFINRPSVRALPALHAQKFHLIYTIIMLIIRLLSLAIGYYVFSSDYTAIALFSISGAILNFVLILITIKFSQRRAFDVKSA